MEWDFVTRDAVSVSGSETIRDNKAFDQSFAQFSKVMTFYQLLCEGIKQRRDILRDRRFYQRCDEIASIPIAVCPLAKDVGHERKDLNVQRGFSCVDQKA